MAVNIVILERKSLGDDIDISKFNDFGNLTVYDFTSSDEVATKVQNADIIIANKAPMNKETLKDAHNLKLICLTATGTNNVDFSYTEEHNILVKNVKSYSTMSVAQHTFALLLYVYEKMSAYDEYVKSGKYCDSPLFSVFDRQFNELDKKVWGIVGLGEIGAKVAQIATSFGCYVIYYSTSGKNNNSSYERVTFDELLKKSDIISVHAPLNDDTYHLFNSEAFDKMKNSAVFLNLGRGPIVCEDALYEALINDKIAAAGLDVLECEPIRTDNKLLKIKDSTKLVITPHIGWATLEARTRCVERTYENVAQFIKMSL